MTMPVLSCLFAALISVGAYIALPLSPVPIVLQNMIIMITGLVLGPVWGTAATSLYLILGALGLPVFAGGTGGIARFMGPTGGYLLGYLIGVPIMGAVAARGSVNIWKNILAASLGTCVVYLFGVIRLKYALDTDWIKAIATGLLPFVLADSAKIVLAALISFRIAPRLSALNRNGYRRAR